VFKNENSMIFFEFILNEITIYDLYEILKHIHKRIWIQKSFIFWLCIVDELASSSSTSNNLY